MKFLIDENIEKPIIEALIKDGHDLKFVFNIHPGLEDFEIIEIANIENRIILTNDKDFADLVFNKKMNHAGVILFRLGNDKETKIKLLRQFLDEVVNDQPINFVVIKKDKITQSTIRWEK